MYTNVKNIILALLIIAAAIALWLYSEYAHSKKLIPATIDYGLRKNIEIQLLNLDKCNGVDDALKAITNDYIQKDEELNGWFSNTLVLKSSAKSCPTNYYIYVKYVYITNNVTQKNSSVK